LGYDGSIDPGHGLINYIDTKAKFRHLKNDLKRDFAADVYLSEAQNPIPPPIHIVYVYTYSIGKGGEGRGLR
jgi:hypothetical protein